jgi:two-component sensor histidine kinase
VLHELATNALKYGALARADGKVLVSWALDHGKKELARFRMWWREIGGPTVVTPQRIGFGTQVINEVPTHELGALVVLDYQPAGLRWSLSMPAARAVDA